MVARVGAFTAGKPELKVSERPEAAGGDSRRDWPVAYEAVVRYWCQGQCALLRALPPSAPAGASAI